MNEPINGNGTQPPNRTPIATTPARSQRPSVTFLFTDLEKSTECWERFPEEMELMLLRHFDVMNEIIKVHGGRIFKTVGDACLAVFEGPAATAVMAAHEAQRRLSRAEWAKLKCKKLQPMKVRMALHTGSAIALRGDYFGSEVCRTARIVDAGHGGQVLLSNTTRTLVCGSLPQGCVLLDMGVHRLNGLIRPERVFQLHATGWPVVRKPLRTAQRLDRPAVAYGAHPGNNAGAQIE